MGTIWRPAPDFQSGPKYQALVDDIRRAVVDGSLPKGEKLPPVRDLAWQLKITPGTVARAYTILTDEGVLQASVGRGTFVADNEVRKTVPSLSPQLDISSPIERPQNDSIIDLRSPILPDLGQSKLIRALLAQGASEMTTELLMSYPQSADEVAAKEAILAKIESFDRSKLTIGHVTLTSGGQHAINIVLHGLLHGPAPVILTEELAYPGIRHAARLARAKLVTIAQDDEGPVPEAILEACRKHDVQVLATSGHAHNPTTIRTSPARRSEIAELARQENFQIMDDQCYSLINGDRPSYRDLAPERAWYISSLSKRISPALRFGWIIAPDGQAENARIVARHSTFGVSSPIVWLATKIMTHPQIGDLQKAVADETAARVGMLADGLRGYDLRSDPRVAFGFLTLPAGWRSSSFVLACERNGILVRSADDFVPMDVRSPNSVRFAINGSVSRDRFQWAVDKVASLLAAPPHEMGA